MKPRLLHWLIPFWLSLFAGGCESIPLQDELPPYVPHNFHRAGQLPETMKRVLLLPVAGPAEAGPETLRELDFILLAALQKQNRFEVVQVSRDESRRLFGRESLNSSSALPSDLVEKLADRYAADGLVFVDVTVYRPNRPQMLGLRAKLADAADARLIWSFDEVVSAEDPAVAASVRRHFRRTRAPVDLSPVSLQSPSRFAAFVAEAMFETLPVR